MSQAMEQPDLGAATTLLGTRPRLVCPQCRAQYEPKRATQGKRVRCCRCGHVWRDESYAIDAVAGALESAATAWSQLGSTSGSKVDHAVTMGYLVKGIAKPVEVALGEWVGRSLNGGRYEVKAVLGHGAMGYVYEAYDRDLRRVVALKVLPRRIPPQHEPVGLKMFLQEARAAAKLQHPNVVTIHEIGQENGTYFFVMERVHGATLTQFVDERGPMPANQASYVMAQAARGLAAGHTAGIIHRDVKPSNIMIDTSGHVKLTDFGLVDVAGIEGMESIPELAGRTLGTPGWISPEVARGERATPATDIYGLGLALYFAMTGRRLIQADTRSGFVRKQREAESVRPEQIPDNWPPRLREIALQCLQADPKDRYQSADLLASDLSRALIPGESDDTVVLGNGLPVNPSNPLASMWTWIGIAFLLVGVAALAIAGWFLG